MGVTGLERGGKEFTPDLYPPFPEDMKPIAVLDTFSLSKLRSDPDQRAKLLQVCKTRGFFYLDFSDTDSSHLPQDADAIGHLAEEVFKLPLEEKLRCKYPENSKKPNSILGYKAIGFTATDAAGTRDTAEFMNIGKDDILDNPARVPTHPPALVFEAGNREILAQFQKGCHRTGLEILSMLATQLHLPADVFASKHRITKPSDDHVRMTRGPPRRSIHLPEIQTPGHTDFGTITILFNWLGGLQVWSEASRGNFYQLFDGVQASNRVAEWLWVKPKPGHAIVNLGDAAVKFTGGVLCSGRHRVVPSPGQQSLWPRYSIVYFVRPEDKCLLKRIEGGDIPKLKEDEKEILMTSSEWIVQQNNMLRDGQAPKAN